MIGCPEVVDPDVKVALHPHTRIPHIRTSAYRTSAHPMSSRSTYFFGNGKAEGTKDMKAILGGKGANLAEMTNLGVPVPPGFTIACDVCIAYLRDGKAPNGLRAE